MLAQFQFFKAVVHFGTALLQALLFFRQLAAPAQRFSLRLLHDLDGAVFRLQLDGFCFFISQADNAVCFGFLLILNFFSQGPRSIVGDYRHNGYIDNQDEWD